MPPSSRGGASCTESHRVVRSPVDPAAPNMLRSEGWKYGFNASQCRSCGFRHLPPTRVCLRCKSVDQMEPERLADVEGTVATFTIDYLAFSLSPPTVGVVVDFDGGGRFRCELTDCDPDAVDIGMRVQMTFRRFYTADGIHNYFWKARPMSDGASRMASDGTHGRNSAAGSRDSSDQGGIVMASNGIRDRVAIVGMGCTQFGERWDKGTDDLLTDAAKDAIASAGVSLDDIDAFWLGTMGSGSAGLTLSRPLSSTTSRSPGWRTSVPPDRRPSATPVMRWPRAHTTWPWRSGWRS